ncbi:class I SAM-dependent DNA methyltransferase [Methylophilus methylotrophus]|uniref:class I SAM-dependent DNA methyltransferase n=1 Tax=Methylophilus methylotrophus TaxID=17 RepID=UPI00036B84DE|nr:DNA methyltransferase [Methylophilus methylotrophus]
MNAVEIEEAVSKLAEQPFDAAEFPYAFLESFGNKETTIKRLKTGGENKSDLVGETTFGVLQRNNIHIAVCSSGETNATLDKLRISPATEKFKAKFILATDGTDFEAEDLTTGETLACRYADFPNHFGFFLALAGISTVKQIRESSFDIRATSRLNRLYVELLKNNPDWSTAERRHDMNHFMARLIFCFFAEDTDIFNGNNLFTATIEQMSAKDASDIDWVIREIFRAMNTPIHARATSNFRPWADAFPYVNGGLFSDSTETPKFTKIARSYLLHVGSLDWTKINPDIFGSMIQAVADDEERGALGMHYTSVPNILKVLNPLFLDDLRNELEAAGDNPRKLINLRKRMAHIRVFDPACGSGNFLVIAYKQMREIEAEINKRRGELHLKTEIPLTNFRGIELRDFSAEIARLALIIAEYQCDVVYIGQKEALQAFLPLDSQNWITCGNALRLDWLTICPPTGTGVKLVADDLFSSSLDQAEIDFENEGGETYICGNPPYKGTKNQSLEQKNDLETVFEKHSDSWKVLDYVAGWYLKAALFCLRTKAGAAFVATNSICQGNQVPVLWNMIFRLGLKISFAHTSFKWANLASNNAGVTVIIVGISAEINGKRAIYSDQEIRVVDFINAYLVPSKDVIVDKVSKSISGLPEMVLGNQPYEGGYLFLTSEELSAMQLNHEVKDKFIRKVVGSNEVINGLERYCIWIEDQNLNDALTIDCINERVKSVKSWRLQSARKGTVAMAARPHQFCEMNIGKKCSIAVPIRSSESREYLPVALLDNKTTITNLSYAMYDAPIFCLAVIASRLHLVWISTVCGKLETRFSYSNKMGWNTFPVPKLTEKNKQDLTRCAEDILLAREAHFPATIADLYDPDNMPENLRRAHDRNDEVLERIYIGRRFKNDTERLEKLFELYTKMKK